MNEMDDWELVAQAQTGDMRAFAILVRRYELPLVHFCQRMTGSLQDAEDLAQEAFVRLHRHLTRLQPQAKFSTVLFGIARNLTLNHVRDANRRGRSTQEPLDQQPLPAEPMGRPDQQARLQEINAMIQHGLNELTPEHREVLLLREMQGMDYDGIAKILGCRTGTVKSRIARAREQLRLRLVQLGGEWL